MPNHADTFPFLMAICLAIATCASSSCVELTTTAAYQTALNDQPATVTL